MSTFVGDVPGGKYTCLMKANSERLLGGAQGAFEPKGRCELHNQTMTITTFKERSHA